VSVTIAIRGDLELDESSRLEDPGTAADSVGDFKPRPFLAVLEVIVEPNRGFQRLATAPSWAWAFVVAVASCALGNALVTPALKHALLVSWPDIIASSPSLSQLPPEVQASRLATSLMITSYSWVLSPIAILMMIAVQTTIMFVSNAIGRGVGTLRASWSAACNIAVPAFGLNAMITAVIVLLRGTNSFNVPGEVHNVIPSLGMLVGGGFSKAHAILSVVTPFSLWNAILIGLAMSYGARVSRGVAWGSGIVTLALEVGLAAFRMR
jgi:hypothetical protein